MKYIKKPIPVEAYQWFGQAEYPNPKFKPYVQAREYPPRYQLNTLEGWMDLNPGSFIVKGPGGEYWAVREGVFKATYEEVQEVYNYD